MSFLRRSFSSPWTLCTSSQLQRKVGLYMKTWVDARWLTLGSKTFRTTEGRQNRVGGPDSWQGCRTESRTLPKDHKDHYQFRSESSGIRTTLMLKLITPGYQKKLGVLPKDTSSGPFIDEWKSIYSEISKDVEEVDIAAALSAAALSVKDENELV